MLTKIVLKKETSAIFLVIILVLGTIALTLPSFSVDAQATKDRDNDYDKDKKDSYEKDNDYKSRNHDEKNYYKYDDKKSYDKDDYKSEYSTYGNYEDRDNEKYNKDSSSSVFVKKVKCNNINVNINGLNANIGLPNNGPVTEPLSLAQEDGDDETKSNSIENDNDGRDGHSDSVKDSTLCINNNNNIVIEEKPIPPTPPESLTCEECFEKFLSQDEIDLFGELFGSTIDRFCILFTNPENEIVVPEDAFRMALPGVDSEDIDDLIDCLEEQGVVFIQDIPPI